MRGVGLVVHGQQDSRLDQDAAQLAFLSLGKKGREQFGGASPLLGLADAVLPDEDGQAALVQHRGEPFGEKQQVAFHQPDGNRVADGFEDAQAGCLGERFLAAALLLFGFESWHRLVRRACFFG